MKHHTAHVDDGCEFCRDRPQCLEEPWKLFKDKEGVAKAWAASREVRRPRPTRPRLRVAPPFPGQALGVGAGGAKARPARKKRRRKIGPQAKGCESLVATKAPLVLRVHVHRGAVEAPRAP